MEWILKIGVGYVCVGYRTRTEDFRMVADCLDLPEAYRTLEFLLEKVVVPYPGCEIEIDKMHA